MLSIRAVARSVPRTLPRISSSPALLRRFPYAQLRPAGVLLQKPSLRPAFSTSSALHAEQISGETDEELSAKLESEIQFEEEMAQSEQVPASIKDFLDNSPFELVDKPGMEDVKLVRNFGDEKITVSFSIIEVPLADESLMEDEAFDDEAALDESTQSNNAQPNATSQGGARSAPAEEEMEEDALDDEGSPATPLSIVIEKPGKGPGALSIEATAQDGNIAIDNVYYFADAAMAHASNPEASLSRVDCYAGPSFRSLDEDLQVLMEQFLEERGVTQALAVFVPDYVDYKEQREYVRWLKDVKTFVEL